MQRGNMMFFAIVDGKHVFGGGSSMQLWDVSESESSRSAKYTGHPVSSNLLDLLSICCSHLLSTLLESEVLIQKLYACFPCRST